MKIGQFMHYCTDSGYFQRNLSNPAELLKHSVREVLRLHKQPLVAIGITEAGILHAIHIRDLTGRLDALCF